MQYRLSKEKQHNPRQFSKEAYQDSDLMCRLETIRLFSTHPKYKAVLSQDLYPDDPKKDYRVDVCLVNRETGSHEHSIEVEMKRSWVSDFPFRDIQFLPRKKEKWDNPVFTYGKPTHWLLFNRDATQHAIVFDNVIRNLSDKRMVRCQVRGMEELYCIDKTYARFNYL